MFSFPFSSGARSEKPEVDSPGIDADTRDALSVAGSRGGQSCLNLLPLAKQIPMQVLVREDATVVEATEREPFTGRVLHLTDEHLAASQLNRLADRRAGRER